MIRFGCYHESYHELAGKPSFNILELSFKDLDTVDCETPNLSAISWIVTDLFFDFDITKDSKLFLV